MKSTASNLQKRGMASPEEISALAGAACETLIKALASDIPGIRSAAAAGLTGFVDEAADSLLRQLAVERSLYTKIAICECLEKGNLETAEKITCYLGVIGRNQHRELPSKVSAKKSYPLARDIAARILGKMSPSVFPALKAVLESGDNVRIREALDAVGFMVFYHGELAVSENLAPVLALIDGQEADRVLVWKALQCLSAFPLPESLAVLKTYSVRRDILGAEARRSIGLTGWGDPPCNRTP